MINDLALLHLANPAPASLDPLPLRFSAAAVPSGAQVVFLGWGINGITPSGETLYATQVGDWTFRDSCFSSGQVCYSRSSGATSYPSAGDSGAPVVSFVRGGWIQVGLFSGPGGAQPTEYGASTLNYLTWIRSQAGLPAVPSNTIVRDSASGASWLVESDGFRHWIPTGGDYLCFTGEGVKVDNMSIFDAKSIPEDYNSHAVCTPPPTPGYRVINADGGVYWRAAPDWNTAIRRTGYGPYTGDRVGLDCWTRGGGVPPFNNDNLWYHATILSGKGRGDGYLNDDFVYTGTYQPVSGVPQCAGRPPAPPTPSVTATNNAGQMAVQLSNFPLGTTYFFCHAGDGSGYPTGGTITARGQVNVTSANQSFSSGLCSGSGNFWIGVQATDGHDYYSNQVVLVPPPPPAGCTAAPTISSYTLGQGSFGLAFAVSFRAYNGNWTFAATDSATGQTVNGSSVGTPADATSQGGTFNDIPVPGVEYHSTITVTTACGSVSADATFIAPTGPIPVQPTISSIPNITIAADDAGSYPVRLNYLDDDCDVAGGTWVDAQGVAHDFGNGPGDPLHPTGCADGIGYLTPGYSSCTSPDGTRGAPGEYPQMITIRDSLGRVSAPYTFYVICR